jgi:N-ethylmaleimide reductase
MSAMTRDLAGPGHTATAETAAYYERRAANGVGLILTEGVIVHPQGDGYYSVPRLHTELQAASWRQVTDRVHACGARIFCQLWHCGRISHSDFLEGAQPVSSTDRAAAGINRQNDKPYGVPRRLGRDEMQVIYEQFANAARLANTAGFDGVELHFGHGYLIDQFFDARVNDRQDDYGGTVENRCRFALELAERVLAECGSERLMLRISPSRDMNGPYDWPDLEDMLSYLIPMIDRIGVRMLDISCARAEYARTSGPVIARVRPMWPHVLIGGASLPPDQAQRELDLQHLDLVTYGRWLLANPDLVIRFRKNDPLTPFDRGMLDRLD